MKKYLFIILLTVLPGCTLSLSLANTHGVASDVVDSEAKTDAKIDPQLTVPASIL